MSSRAGVGALFRDFLRTLAGERRAFGVFETRGAIVVPLLPQSEAAKEPLPAAHCGGAAQRPFDRPRASRQIRPIRLLTEPQPRAAARPRARSSIRSSALLEPDRQTQQPVADADARARLRRQPLMRRRRRMGDEALGVAEVVGDLDDLQRVGEAEGRGLAALDVERRPACRRPSSAACASAACG